MFEPDGFFFPPLPSPAVTGALQSSQTRLNAGGKSKHPWCPRHVSGLVKHTKSPCVAPETEARRQRFCAEVVGDSGHVTARRRHQSSTRSVNRVAARRSGARRRRTTYLDPRFNRLCSTENPEITLFAFVYVKVSFVLCFVLFLFYLANYREQHGDGMNLAGFHPAAINCVAMVLRGNIPPAAAAAFLYSHKRDGHSQRTGSLFNGSF